MGERINRSEYFLRMAMLAAMRSTCHRRHTGCILVDERGHVMATGYNGVPIGVAHCNYGWPCPAAHAKPGESLDGCMATHAEQNALLQCPDVFKIATAYCTDSPCIHCTKLLMNTSCYRVVFARQYPQKEPEQLWRSVRGDRWVHQPLEWPFAIEESHYRKVEPS